MESQSKKQGEKFRKTEWKTEIDIPSDTNSDFKAKKDTKKRQTDRQKNPRVRMENRCTKKQM